MQHPPNTGNLAGKQVFVSRPPADALDFSGPLQAAGAHVLAAPLIETVPVPFEPPPAEAYDWIFLTSRNAAQCALPLADQNKPVAAVGPATAGAATALGFTVSFLPGEHHARGAAQAFLKTFSGKPLRLLWPCGDLSDPEPAGILTAGGMTVLRQIVYETRPATALPPNVDNALAAGVDVLAFTSPSSVFSFQDRGYPVGRAAIVCIGPATTAAARHILGRCDREAPVHTLAGLAEAVMAVNTPA